MKKIEKNKENTFNCSCPKCPSYNVCAKNKNDNLYCSDEEENNCSFQLNGCICPGCVVHHQFELKKIYYCIHGSANKIE